MFGASSIVKNSEKEKWVYSGIEITFDGAGSRNFGNDFASKIVIFGIDNSSSARTDNCRNNLLRLGDEPIYDINGSFGINASNHTKYIILNNQQCMTQPAFINLNPIGYGQGLHYYLFAVNLDRCICVNNLLMIYLTEYVFQIKQKI